MAATTNGYANGVNGHVDPIPLPRFHHVPAAIDIPVRGDDGDEAVNLDLTELMDETDELCDLLQNENAAHNFWITIALAYTKQGKADIAMDILNRGLSALQDGPPVNNLSILACLCWLNLLKCRRAPRVRPNQPTQSPDDERTKEYWLAQATGVLNEASRIDPSYPALFLARGTLYLLRASLLPSKVGPGSQEQSDRGDTLKQAAKCFDDAYRVSNNKNILAIIGKAKTMFSFGKYAEALTLYQQSLERAPDLLDPDPRIGIGCCLWHLGHKDLARDAWERSLTLNEGSKIANLLLGLYHLEQSSHFDANDPEFAAHYKKAITIHTQTAFKMDQMYALSCSTFGAHFLSRQDWGKLEKLARRAIEHTDVNAIASDGWYLLAKQNHLLGDLAKAQDQYNKADQARGGDEKGFLPAKFGVAQLKTITSDIDGAKFRLEKMIATSKSVEAMSLLGILHAEDVFMSQAAGSREDKGAERKKAIMMLESVRLAWKDPKKNISPDSGVLLTLARLYESDQPDKSLGCLQQVEQLEIDEVPEDDLPENILEDEVAKRSAKRDTLSPQLLNNIACFYFQAEKLSVARDYFQSALRSSVSLGDKDTSTDTDALVSTISFNLGRTYEAEGVDEEAKKIYLSLLDRHAGYTDARIRLAYLELRSNSPEGAEAVKQLVESEPGNLDVRSLYGWYINRHKKRTLALNEDAEQKHYKHTLVTYDKHDLYSLVGMGNLHLTVAREMPRDTDQHKERRSKTFTRAVEFFDKVLLLDPKNAFAAQGLAIALVEEKKDTSTAVQIFSKVRESIRDASVHVNLGHVFCDLKQFSRSIENYELALAKSRSKDPQIMACLGRAWLLRARTEKNFEHFKISLDYSKQALELTPDNVNFQFNVAFVQIQIAQMMISQPEATKTLTDVQAASDGLDAAIASFTQIARSPNPPYPKNDLEQRANMGRNTQKRQLATAIEKQTEYEKKNAARLEEAKKRREDDIKKREEEKRAAAEKAEEHRQKVREQREKMMEEDCVAMERRLEEDKAREEAEYTTDAETGERKKREKKPKEKRAKRKKKGADSDIEDDDVLTGTDGEGRKGRTRSGADGSGTSDGEAPRRKKKRRLERKGTAVKSSKFKSAEMVQDSDDDDDAGLQPAIQRSDDVEVPDAADNEAPADVDDAMDDDEEAAVARTSRRKQKLVLDDEEDDDDEAPATNNEDAVMEAGDSDHGGD